MVMEKQGPQGQSASSPAYLEEKLDQLEAQPHQRKEQESQTADIRFEPGQRTEERGWRGEVVVAERKKMESK